MITRSETNKYPALNIRISATTFEKAGETATRKTVLPVNKKTYGPRHMVVSGGFKMIYPDSLEQEDIGMVPTVYPIRDAYASNTLQFEALADNSKYYCVIPYTGYEIEYDVINVESTNSVTLPIGHICFVFGGQHTINNEIQNTSCGIYVLENNSVELTANVDVSVYAFRAVAIPV